MQKIIILLFINLISLNVYSNHLWDKDKSYQPEIYSTLDSKNTIEFVKKWHEIASNEWGNYGPLEIYLVGKDMSKAKKLENEFCERHIKLDKEWKKKLKSEGKPVSEGWSKKWDCANKNHKIFTMYAEEGNAAVSTYLKEHLNYQFSTLIMSYKRPKPGEKDYAQVFLHEYFHVYQHAHVSDRCSDDQRKKCERNKKTTGEYEKRPWLQEGGAEFVSILLYSRTMNDKKYLIERMRWKLKDSLKAYKKKYKMKLKDINYKKDKNIAYDMGAWFTAYLISNEGEKKFTQDFYRDLDTLGFEKSFKKNFGKSSDEYISDFNEFIIQRKNKIFKILKL